MPSTGRPTGNAPSGTGVLRSTLLAVIRLASVAASRCTRTQSGEKCLRKAATSVEKTASPPRSTPRTVGKLLAFFEVAREVAEERRDEVQQRDLGLSDPARERLRPAARHVEGAEGGPAQEAAEDVGDRAREAVGEEQGDAVRGPHPQAVDVVARVLEQVAVALEDALGLARRARRVEERGDLVGADRRAPRSPRKTPLRARRRSRAASHPPRDRGRTRASRRRTTRAGPLRP